MYLQRLLYGLRCLLPALLFATAPLLVSMQVQAQSAKYEIKYGNNSIGVLSVRQEVSGTTRKIAITSSVQSKLFARMEIDIFAEFQHNILLRARVIRKAAEQEVTTAKTDKGYLVNRKNEKSILARPQITFTVSDLYFTEPVGIKEAYSETLGKILPLSQLPDQRYELQLPEGKRNIFRYEKGKLVEVEINHALGKAWFKLIRE